MKRKVIATKTFKEIDVEKENEVNILFYVL